jgi:hypothetical protein
VKKEKKMKKLNIVLAMLISVIAVSSCNQEGTTGADLGDSKTALRSASMIDENSDVMGMKYTVTPCDNPNNPTVVNRPLEDQILPGNIPELANQPVDEISEHLYSDMFQVLEPGCYNVNVQPVTATGEDSEVCAAAWKNDVEVLEGEVTEILLLVQCAGSDNGSLDVIAAINHEPSLDHVTFDDSKFVCGDSERICLFGSDVDKDPLEFELVVSDRCTVTGPPIPHVGEACFDISCHDWGKVDLIAKVYDLVWRDDQLVRIETWLSDEGYPNESHGQLDFFAYFDGVKYYPDADQDGFGDMTADPTLVCEGDPAPGGSVTDNTDCDDVDDATNPGAQELCDNDGKDSNCNGPPNDSCECPEDTIECGSQCVDDSCTGGKMFDTATCACECPADTIECGGGCVDNSCTGGKLFDMATCTCECPANSSAHPIDIHVYYRYEWGYHCCDAAVFDVDMNGVPLGQINLNNGTDCGSRDSVLTASQAQVTAAAAATGPIKLNFVCSYGQGACHSNVGYVEATNPLNGAILYSGQQDDSVLELSVCF